MGDIYPVVKVAAVQAASVFLDREGSTEKACRLIREAGRNGAQVIGFPEGFSSMGIRSRTTTMPRPERSPIGWPSSCSKMRSEFLQPEIDTLCAAARDAGAYVVIGVCEKLPRTLGTMFNSQVFIAPDGTYMGRHQKIMPTAVRRAAGPYGPASATAACVPDELRPDDSAHLQ